MSSVLKYVAATIKSSLVAFVMTTTPMVILVNEARAAPILFEDQNGLPDQAAFMAAIDASSLVTRTFEGYDPATGPVRGWGMPSVMSFSDSGVSFATTLAFFSDCRYNCPPSNLWTTTSGFQTGINISAYVQSVPEGTRAILANIYLPTDTTAFGINIAWAVATPSLVSQLGTDLIEIVAHLRSGTAVSAPLIFHPNPSYPATWSFYGIVSPDDPIDWIAVNDASRHLGNNVVGFDNVMTARAAVTVPEPSAVCLLLLGLLSMAWCWSKRTRIAACQFSPYRSRDFSA